jgi:hypothetical protein
LLGYALGRFLSGRKHEDKNDFVQARKDEDKMRRAKQSSPHSISDLKASYSDHSFRNIYFIELKLSGIGDTTLPVWNIRYPLLKQFFRTSAASNPRPKSDLRRKMEFFSLFFFVRVDKKQPNKKTIYLLSFCQAQMKRRLNFYTGTILLYVRVPSLFFLLFVYDIYIYFILL